MSERGKKHFGAVEVDQLHDEGDDSEDSPPAPITDEDEVVFYPQ